MTTPHELLERARQSHIRNTIESLQDIKLVVESIEEHLRNEDFDMVYETSSELVDVANRVWLTTAILDTGTGDDA